MYLKIHSYSEIILSELVQDLFKASKEGDSSTVCSLLQQKIDVNTTPKSPPAELGLHADWTALMHAVYYHHVPVCEELLRFRAGTEVRDSDGNTALHIAVGLKDTTISSELVCLLTRHGADVNAVNGRKESPGHIAAENDDVASLEELWSHGADFGLKNNEGKRPLEVAQEKRVILKMRKAPAFLQSCSAGTTAISYNKVTRPDTKDVKNTKCLLSTCKGRQTDQPTYRHRQTNRQTEKRSSMLLDLVVNVVGLQPRHRCSTRGDLLRKIKTTEEQNQKQKEELRSKNTQIEALKKEVQRLESENKEWQELCSTVAKRKRPHENS